MAVTRRVKTNDRSPLSGGGGRTARSGELEEGRSSASSEERQVSLRIPAAVLERVDAAVNTRVVRIPRHTWLLEAIVEKLDREASNPRSGHGAQ